MRPLLSGIHQVKPKMMVLMTIFREVSWFLLPAAKEKGSSEKCIKARITKKFRNKTVNSPGRMNAVVIRTIHIAMTKLLKTNQNEWLLNIKLLKVHADKSGSGSSQGYRVFEANRGWSSLIVIGFYR